MFAKRTYLLDVTRRVPKMRTFTEWVDLLAHCRYNEFWLYSDAPLPEDGVDLNRLRDYCAMQDIALATCGRGEWDAWVGAGDSAIASTEAAASLAGRVEDMRERMERAEQTARARGVDRFVVTDFADDCVWQPLAASLPGIIMGGGFAFAGRSSAKMDLERELNGVLGAPVGGLLLKLGTLYLRGGARRDGCSEYFNILSHDHGYSRHPGLTQAVLDDVSGIAHGIRIAAERWSERCDWADEIAYMALLMDCACHRRDEARLRLLRDRHGLIWRRRFLEDGRIESLARLPRF